jgi:hypothetical protein
VKAISSSAQPDTSGGEEGIPPMAGSGRTAWEGEEGSSVHDAASAEPVVSMSGR